MDALHPAVVSSGMLVLDMRLELDDVGVWHLLCIRGRQYGSSILVDGSNVEDGRR